MSEATERQILYICRSRGCSNIAHEEKTMFPKRDWQQMYDKVRRNSPVEWAGYSVLGLRMIDRKQQLLIQGDTECDKCRSPIHELPNKKWKSSNIEFREYNNKGTGHIYRCARCGKPVKSWLIVRAGLIFGYRCARKLARAIKQGASETELWAIIEEAQEARKAHGRIPPPKQMREDVLKELTKTWPKEDVDELRKNLEEIDEKEDGPKSKIPSPEQMVKDVINEYLSTKDEEKQT